MDGEVVIRAGETVTFPVASDHPLAQYQQLQRPSSVPNLHDLALARVMTKAQPQLPTASLSQMITGVLASAGVDHILTVTLPDITVQPGATLYFAGPITHVTARHVTVEGSIRASGSFNLVCATLGGGGIRRPPYPAPVPVPAGR
jgi:hypothetical protein